RSLEEIHSGRALDSCAYLHACIEEALRLSPAVAALLPREVMAGGIVIDGQHIPQGTVVGVPSYVVQHDQSTFPEPWKFKPERWIVGTTTSKEDLQRAREALCPFSLGSRGGIGKQLASLEMRLALVALLWAYDLREVESGRKGGGGKDLERGRE